ncbi:MAG: YSC84-related protein [Burkholderiales bacterium]
MLKRKFVSAIGCAALLLAGCTTTSNSASSSDASKRHSLDASVDNAMSKLYRQVPDSSDLVRQAKGVLVFPSVITAGLVVGASYGQGTLRQGGATTAYYSLAGGSFGWLAGADSEALYVLFMTQESLDKFKASKGWTAGIDASITLVTVGASGKVDTRTIKQPVVGFALTNGGLLANLSLEGSKISRLDL